MTFRIGLVSDTHGLIRPEVVTALAGCDALLHAGDIGTLEVLETLQRLAPLHAIRGNVDRGSELAHVPEVRNLMLGGIRIHLVHRPQDVREPAARAADVVICGHSHRPRVDRVFGTLRINPGSAGPRRFSLPISVGILDVTEGRCRPHLITLGGPPRPQTQPGA
ncbi:MAG: metallophosphoesterase family protein [Myxococcota bacterium]|nr:metallophosphoesterase family protein [Myxococcota bacterium]MEC8423869.1 metallophosphoesterase family protein [Myxococcota bacterium]